MTVSFYIEVEDLFILDKYLEDYDGDEDDTPIYYSNQPVSPTQVLTTLDFHSFNEMIDLELLLLF